MLVLMHSKLVLQQQHPSPWMQRVLVQQLHRPLETSEHAMSSPASCKAFTRCQHVAAAVAEHKTW
jgi:hypothetical protein